MEARIMAFIHFFNIKRDYFECHEYGESLWLDSGRPDVLKGLIQSAVCLYHLENGNVKGAVSMWLRARRYLDPYLPVYEAIDLAQLICDIDAVFARIPSDWYQAEVKPREVQALALPLVTIRLTDARLAGEIANFIPQPLE